MNINFVAFFSFYKECSIKSLFKKNVGCLITKKGASQKKKHPLHPYILGRRFDSFVSVQICLDETRAVFALFGGSKSGSKSVSVMKVNDCPLKRKKRIKNKF